MSAIINWPKLKDLFKLYLNHPKHLETEDNGTVETLKCWKVSKAALEDLLNQANEEIEEVAIIPIVRPEDEQKSVNNQYFSMALAGINDKNELVTSLAYDYNKPCPKKCPVNFSQVLP